MFIYFVNRADRRSGRNKRIAIRGLLLFCIDGLETVRKTWSPFREEFYDHWPGVLIYFMLVYGSKNMRSEVSTYKYPKHPPQRSEPILSLAVDRQPRTAGSATPY